MLNAQEIRVAPFGRVLVAEVGTAPPSDLETEYSAEWHELGYLSEDGVQLTPNLTTESYSVWQSRLPAKVLATVLEFTAQFTMSQMNTDTTSVFFFGAEWVEESPGVYRLAVASDQQLRERALSVEWTDDAGYKNRLTLPRGFVSNRETLTLNRTNVSEMGVTFQALDSDGLALEFISENPSFEPAGS